MRAPEGPPQAARVLCFGSLNIDHVYQVEHIARPGETLTTRSYQVFAGGKGANQSAALGRAGARAYHAGRVGADGQWLLGKLTAAGVDVSRVTVGAEPTGHAVIQVDARGENAIFLYPGANHAQDEARLDLFLDSFGHGDVLLLQNEISSIPTIVKKAHSRGMRVIFNPAPFTPQLDGYPLDLVDVLIANQTEAAGLTGRDSGPLAAEGASPHDLLAALAVRLPQAELVLTLGAEGALYRTGDTTISVRAEPVTAVDTTGAGDAFIGYLVAALAAGSAVATALRRASVAAALACTRPGAMDSIPGSDQVDAHLAKDIA